MDLRKRSQKQEKRTAKQFKGRVTPGSGCIDGFKGDVRTDDYLIENKFTTSSYVLKKNTWEKIRKEALRDGLRESILQLDFVISEYVSRSFVIMEFDYFMDNFYNVFIHRSFDTNKSFTIKLEEVLEDINEVESFCWKISFNKLHLIMISLGRFLEEKELLK